MPNQIELARKGFPEKVISRLEPEDLVHQSRWKQNSRQREQHTQNQRRKYIAAFRNRKKSSIAKIQNAKGRMATEDSGDGKRGHLMKDCGS